MKGKYLNGLGIFSVLHHYTVSQGEEKKIKPQQIQAISQGDTKAKDVLKSEQVCSKHFVFRGPSPYLEKHNVDSVPTLELGKKSHGCEIDYEASAKRKKEQREERNMPLSNKNLKQQRNVRNSIKAVFLWPRLTLINQAPPQKKKKLETKTPFLMILHVMKAVSLMKSEQKL